MFSRFVSGSINASAFPAIARSTAYSVGQVVYIASIPGFYKCISAGTTDSAAVTYPSSKASSYYRSVTDGTAMFVDVTGDFTVGSWGVACPIDYILTTDNVNSGGKSCLAYGYSITGSIPEIFVDNTYTAPLAKSGINWESQAIAYPEPIGCLVTTIISADRATWPPVEAEGAQFDFNLGTTGIYGVWHFVGCTVRSYSSDTNSLVYGWYLGDYNSPHMSSFAMTRGTLWVDVQAGKYAASFPCAEISSFDGVKFRFSAAGVVALSYRSKIRDIKAHPLTKPTIPFAAPAMGYIEIHETDFSTVQSVFPSIISTHAALCLDLRVVRCNIPDGYSIHTGLNGTSEVTYVSCNGDANWWREATGMTVRKQFSSYLYQSPMDEWGNHYGFQVVTDEKLYPMDDFREVLLSALDRVPSGEVSVTWELMVQDTFTLHNDEVWMQVYFSSEAPPSATTIEFNEASVHTCRVRGNAAVELPSSTAIWTSPITGMKKYKLEANYTCAEYDLESRIYVAVFAACQSKEFYLAAAPKITVKGV